MCNGGASFANKLTFTAATKGIQFETTDSGGAITSQTLDDYEEGTWTLNGPFNVLRCYTASYLLRQNGQYTKISAYMQAFKCDLIQQPVTDRNTQSRLRRPDDKATFSFANSLSADYAGGGLLTFNSIAIGGNKTVQLYTVRNTTRVSLYIEGDEFGKDAAGTDISNANFFGTITYVTDQ